MGRAKLKMKLIEKEKSRTLTYKKRSEGLKKKLHQLSTLCDIDACMIINSPYQNQASIWPENDPGQVRRLVEAYKAKSKEIGGVKTYGLSDFFEERQRKAEEEVAKLRKRNSETKYPTWNHQLNLLNESQLKGLGAALQNKSQMVRSRIQFLKMREKQELENLMMQFNQNYPQFNPVVIMKSNYADFATPITYDVSQLPVIAHHHQYYAPPAPAPLPLPPSNMYYTSMEDKMRVAPPPPNYSVPNIGYTSMEEKMGVAPPNIGYSSTEENVSSVDEDGDVTRYFLQV